jgi:L(+)-tartrate dehydratase beta subunit
VDRADRGRRPRRPQPESLWKFRIRDFGPLLVAMDSHGGSAYDIVKHDVQAARAQVLQDLGVGTP